MLDRESTFAEPEIVRLLQSEFVPVAIDQAYQRRQQDTEGDFYRKIASQHHGNDFKGTTQGFYIATAGGDLLLYNNNRDPAKVRRLMQDLLAKYRSQREKQDASPVPIKAESHDTRFHVSPPEGGLVLRARAKVLDGYEPTDNRWRKIFQSAISRDNVWITREEREALAAGRFPETLQRRIARFHFVDNTRGEPPFWKPNDLKKVDFQIESGKIRGVANLETSDRKRGYDAEIYGVIESNSDEVTGLDFVVRGDFWGEGRFTRGAPEGKFPLAIWFTLADGSDIADEIPPQGSRGWVDGYLREHGR